MGSLISESTKTLSTNSSTRMVTMWPPTSVTHVEIQVTCRECVHRAATEEETSQEEGEEEEDSTEDMDLDLTEVEEVEEGVEEEGVVEGSNEAFHHNIS